ncbi:PIN domain-containing protein [Allostella humosa]|uniref:putative toxin-antitoxin system toxin component, PIN family n=1 Tax=Stella humosa TaxID=94 RepID=UPI001134BE50|nr:putative toxin-antitoxin system toxin component, PIN family [Stella humosa]BBK32184.1 PIN domain-containing protein [Stella humosa]
MVLDTSTLVAAVRSDLGASRRLLVAALERRLTILVSVLLMFEYEAVLTRPEHLAKARITVEDAQVLLDAVGAIADPVVLAFLWRPTLADPDDDMVLETAVNGRAAAIVTYNVRDFMRAGQRFGLEILRPAEAAQRLEATK